MTNKRAEPLDRSSPRPKPNLGWSGGRRLSDLAPRVGSSLVLAAAPLAAVWLGGAPFSLIWFVATIAVGWEWQTLIGAPRPRLRFLAAATGLALAAYLTATGRFGVALVVLSAAGLLAAAVAGSGRRLWAFGGVPYAGALIVSVSFLYFSPTDGARAIIWLCAVVWGTDVFAYFGGRLIGGPKLWPLISPSKTWSGTLCGVAAGASLGALVGAYGPGRVHAPIFALGLVAAMISQAGDIFESFVKRRFGVKDSSALIPGHGGFMDRLDGFIAAAAFAALIAAARGGPGPAAALFDWF